MSDKRRYRVNACGHACGVRPRHNTIKRAGENMAREIVRFYVRRLTLLRVATWSTPASAKSPRQLAALSAYTISLSRTREGPSSEDRRPPPSSEGHAPSTTCARTHYLKHIFTHSETYAPSLRRLHATLAPALGRNPHCDGWEYRRDGQASTANSPQPTWARPSHDGLGCNARRGARVSFASTNARETLS